MSRIFSGEPVLVETMGAASGKVFCTKLWLGASKTKNFFVFRMRSGRAGPYFRFRPKVCKVRAEGRNNYCATWVSHVSPLCTPPRVPIRLFHIRGGRAFFLVRMGRMSILSFWAK